MCVICVKKKGVKLPSYEDIRDMWEANPHGAGFMFVRNEKVYIRKGFMTLEDFNKALSKENFTKDDVIVMHFRISTQAGVNPEMTHPFALTKNIEKTKILNVVCDIGVAHNGIIKMTSNGNKEYSDTAIFVTQYMTKLIRNFDDFYNPAVREMIEELAKSKLAILTKDGDVAMIGDFKEVDGLYYSNLNHVWRTRWERAARNGYIGYWNNLFGNAKA